MASLPPQQQDALAGLPVGLLPISYRLHPGSFFVARDYRTRPNKAADLMPRRWLPQNAGFLAMSQKKSCMVLSWNPLPYRQVIVRKDRGNVYETDQCNEVIPCTPRSLTIGLCPRGFLFSGRGNVKLNNQL